MVGAREKTLPRTGVACDKNSRIGGSESSQPIDDSLKIVALSDDPVEIVDYILFFSQVSKFVVLLLLFNY